MNVVELAPHVSPASHLLDLLAVEPVEAGIGIGLQDAGEVSQMCPRPLALAIRAVAEEHRWSIGAARRAIIAHISPQSSLLGAAATWAEDRHRSVITMDLVGAEYVAANRVYQGHEQRTAITDPVGESRAIEIEAVSSVDL